MSILYRMIGFCLFFLILLPNVFMVYFKGSNKVMQFGVKMVIQILADQISAQKLLMGFQVYPLKVIIARLHLLTLSRLKAA